MTHSSAFPLIHMCGQWADVTSALWGLGCRMSGIPQKKSKGHVGPFRAVAPEPAGQSCLKELQRKEKNEPPAKKNKNF